MSDSGVTLLFDWSIPLADERHISILAYLVVHLFFDIQIVCLGSNCFVNQWLIISSGHRLASLVRAILIWSISLAMIED